jgi:hypothetical protein
VATAGLVAVCLVGFATPASAAGYEQSVGLGTAGAYSVLAGSTVTNTGNSDLSGSLGVSPGSAITGFPPGLVHGATNVASAAAGAKDDLTTAYNDAAGRTATGTSLGSALAGGTLAPGVYNAASALDLSGAITLDGQGDPNSVFIFEVGAALTTATSTSIVFLGNAQACNVFWQVGTSATLGTTNVFAGTIMANASISVDNGTSIAGRALARVGAVTLINDTFTSAACVSTPTTTAVSATPTTTGGTSTLTATVAAPGANTPTGGTVTFTVNGVTVGTATAGPTGTATLTVPAGSIARTVTVSAHYNGLINYGSSTSVGTGLVVTAAAAPPATGPPNTTTTSTTTTGTTTTLANTGPTQLVALGGAAGALLLVGTALTWTGRARYPRKHAS